MEAANVLSLKVKSRKFKAKETTDFYFLQDTFKVPSTYSVYLINQATEAELKPC